jgi:energy-coupling factor transporter ATP-binding protein EcfA2
MQYRRKHVGFVFQFYNLMPNLTALENVELAAQICDNPLDAVSVLKEVGLQERAAHFPAQLSGGEQQRVSIARAVAKNPTLLLCDEPTGALDYMTGKAILKLLRDVNREFQKTVMLITHNSPVAQMADKVVRMKNGKVESLEAIKSKAEIVANTQKAMEAQNNIIVFMILGAGILAFAVIYNIANINIFGRRREIATLAVLGFNSGELKSLVFNENYFISALGIIGGILPGRLLLQYVVTMQNTDEMQMPVVLINAEQLNYSWSLSDPSPWISVSEFDKFWRPKATARYYSHDYYTANHETIYGYAIYRGDAVILHKGIAGWITIPTHAMIISRYDTANKDFKLAGHSNERQAYPLLSAIANYSEVEFISF